MKSASGNLSVFVVAFCSFLKLIPLESYTVSLVTFLYCLSILRAAVAKSFLSAFKKDFSSGLLSEKFLESNSYLSAFKLFFFPVAIFTVFSIVILVKISVRSRLASLPSVAVWGKRWSVRIGDNSTGKSPPSGRLLGWADFVLLLYVVTNAYLFWLFNKSIYFDNSDPPPKWYLESRFHWINPFLIASGMIIFFPIFCKVLDYCMFSFLFEITFERIGNSEGAGGSASRYGMHSQLFTESSCGVGDVDDVRSYPIFRAILFCRNLLLCQYFICLASLFHVMYLAPFDERYYVAIWAYSIPYLLVVGVYFLFAGMPCDGNSESVGRDWCGRRSFKEEVSSRNCAVVLFVVYVVMVLVGVMWKKEWRMGLGGKEYGPIHDSSGSIVCHMPEFYFPFIKFIAQSSKSFLHDSVCPDKRSMKRRLKEEQVLQKVVRDFAVLEHDILSFKDSVCPSSYEFKRSYVLCSDFVSSLPYSNLKRLAEGSDGNKKCKEGEYNVEYDYERPVNVTGYGFVRAFCGSSEISFLRNIVDEEAIERVEKHLSLKRKEWKYKEFDREKAYNDMSKGSSDGVKLNVLVLLFDGLSRAHFFRTLPKTAQLLEELYNPVGTFSGSKDEIVKRAQSYQFFHYNSVWLNTEINTGVMSAGRKDNGDVDNMSYWINSFRSNGFVTSDVNGMCQSTFFYHEHGSTQLSDHEVSVEM